MASSIAAEASFRAGFIDSLVSKSSMTSVCADGAAFAEETVRETTTEMSTMPNTAEAMAFLLLGLES